MHLVLAGGWVVYPSAFQMDLDLLIQVGGQVEDPSLYVKLIGRIGRAVYASPKYLQLRGQPTLPSQLSEHACITVGERGGQSIWRLRNGPEVLDIKLTPYLSVNEPAITYQLAVEGVGIAIVDDWMIPSMPKGALVRLLPQWEPEPVDVYALYPSRLGLSTKVRVFVEFMEKNLAPRLRLTHNLQPTVLAEKAGNTRPDEPATKANRP